MQYIFLEKNFIVMVFLAVNLPEHPIHTSDVTVYLTSLPVTLTAIRKYTSISP